MPRLQSAPAPTAPKGKTHGFLPPLSKGIPRAKLLLTQKAIPCSEKTEQGILMYLFQIGLQAIDGETLFGELPLVFGHDISLKIAVM